jgi:hypothetical protein
MLDDALVAVDHSIAANSRGDGLYHAYNTMIVRGESVVIDRLYAMLEGQVAVLSSGAIPPDQAIAVLEALFDSDVYRADQGSFMLYPDRDLPDFLEKNRVPAADVERIPLLQQMLADGDGRILVRDAEGCYRFSADFANVGDLSARLDTLAAELGDKVQAAREPLELLYEKVFNHRAFTGRSGGMFGFEGLGCIYWHMVSKLLLATQENFFAALEQDASKKTRGRLGELYYRIRDGIGFNKTPAEYGAFPADPYSHTPKHAGARQPGMTGQVKEEILTRFGELGVRVRDGAVHFQPGLLRRREFARKPQQFRYLDVDNVWQNLAVEPGKLAFTWCQIPLVYELSDEPTGSITLLLNDGEGHAHPQLRLSADDSAQMFRRSGHIRRIDIKLPAGDLFGD